MPAESYIHPALRLKHTRIWGRTDYAEVEACFFKSLRHPSFRTDLRTLVDMRELTDAVGGLWEFWKLKELYKSFYPPTAQAVDVVLLTNSAIAYRAARIFAWVMRDAHPLRVRVTNDLEKALRLLSLPPGCLADDQPTDSHSNIIPFARSKA
jgi:hypothetical protein